MSLNKSRAAFARPLVAAVLLTALGVPLFAEDSDAELLKAARDGDVAAVKSFLATGANMNAQGRRGQTALVLAAQRGHTDTVSVLISAGANANMQDNSGRTALILASQNGHTDTVRLLVNVDVNNADAALIVV